ncbi:hypothetical protein D3C81_376510 [compost metagenome]
MKPLPRFRHVYGPGLLGLIKTSAAFERELEQMWDDRKRTEFMMAAKASATPAQLDYLLNTRPDLFHRGLVRKVGFQDFRHHQTYLQLWGEHDGNG